MSAATFITNATAGAPVLNGTEGSLSGLMRYLAPILGWSIEFDNGPIIVVKPQSYKGGQALFYRIDDRAARGGAAPRVAEVRAYESMSDINTGAGLVGPAYIHKSYYANTTGYPYKIAGDQFGFFIQAQCFHSGGFNSLPLNITYMGFLNPLLASDVPVCALFGDAVDGASYGSNLVYASANGTVSRPGLYIHRSRGGSLNVPVANYSSGINDFQGHAMGSLFKTSANDANAIKPLPSLGATLAAPIYTNDGVGYTISGIVPGYSCQSATYVGYTLLEYILCGAGSGVYNYGQLLIPQGEDFRP